MEVEENIFSSDGKVEEVNESDDLTPKDRLLHVLDDVEAHVEELRRNASRLELDRDHLLSAIHTLKSMESLNDFDENDKEDILRYLDRIHSRCRSVDVAVHTERNDSQIESLHQVNCLIDNLIIGMKSSPDSTRLKCLSYVSACTSSVSGIEIDKTFEMAVLGCALDDQKRIRHRLNGLLDYVTKQKWKNDVKPME